MTIQQALEMGMQFQRAGNLDQARSIYEQILARAPDYADALHLLGLLYLGKGELARAEELVAATRVAAAGHRTKRYCTALSCKCMLT